MSTIDNNIISSLGVGSGIDTKALVKQLTEIEGSAKQARIDSTRKETEATISDYGYLKSSLLTLQSSLNALTNPEGLFSKSAAFTETDAIVPEKLGTEASVGTYSLEVLDTAQAQSLASARFTDPSDPVGKGSITFQLGEWDESAGTFAASATAESKTITIDDNNNSLEGLRDAINKADFGVQASIVNDGTGYKLLMSAPSGASNELRIQVEEDAAAPTNHDAAGLSRFAFNETTEQMQALQDGRDAKLKVNGLEVTRSTNHIDDVLEGFSFSVVKAAPGEVATLTISDDKAYAEQKIREFVEAYNSFYDAIRPMFNHDASLPEDSDISAAGSLASDALAKSIVSQIKTVIASAIPGLGEEGFNALSTIGIRTAKDDTLFFAKDETQQSKPEYFREAMDEHFDLVQELFGASTSSTAAGVEVTGYQDRTIAGTYDVNVTQAPAKGYFTGDAANVALDFAGKDYNFTIKVDGAPAANILWPVGTSFDSMADLADEMQSRINSHESLASRHLGVIVTYDSDSGAFTFESKAYGSDSKISFGNSSDDFLADFGITNGTAVAGQDVKGTIGGKEAFGSGNVLLPDLQSDASGMSLRVNENVALNTPGTVSYSRGFAGQLSNLIDQFQQEDGAIGTRTTTLEDRLETLDTDQKRHDSRMSAFHDRMLQQFIAMENILNGLNSSGGYLENLIDTLPFTAKK